MHKTLDLITTALALLSLAALAALSVRGIVNPQAAAAAFGVAAADPSAAFYHAVYRDRNLVLALAGFAYLFAGMWRALAMLVTACVTLPAYDIAALRLADVSVAWAHPVTLATLVLLAILLWVRALRKP